MVIGGHGIAIRDTRKGDRKYHKLNSNGKYSHLRFMIGFLEITEKDFGKGDNNGKDSVMWKNREKDWYNAERRFIFAP